MKSYVLHVDLGLNWRGAKREGKKGGQLWLVLVRITRKAWSRAPWSIHALRAVTDGWGEWLMHGSMEPQMPVEQAEQDQRVATGIFPTGYAVLGHVPCSHACHALSMVLHQSGLGLLWNPQSAKNVAGTAHVRAGARLRLTLRGDPLGLMHASPG